MFSQAIKSETRNRSRPTISLGGFFSFFFLAPTVEVINSESRFLLLFSPWKIYVIQQA